MAIMCSLKKQNAIWVDHIKQRKKLKNGWCKLNFLNTAKGNSYDLADWIRFLIETKLYCNIAVVSKTIAKNVTQLK